MWYRAKPASPKGDSATARVPKVGMDGLGPEPGPSS